MASLISLLFLLSLSTASTSAVPNVNIHRLVPVLVTAPSPSVFPRAGPAPDVIQQACKATRFPDSCVSSLSQSSSIPPDATPTELILAAISVSLQNLQTVQSMARAILEATAGNPNGINNASSCVENLGFSVRRLVLTAYALPVGRVKDARAWGSAALAYQYGCFSCLKYVNGTKQLVNDTMWLLRSLTRLTSNALSMLFAYERFGNDTFSWAPPQTEREGYWGDDSANGGIGEVGTFRGGIPSNLQSPHATVCKNCGCNRCFSTVQAAVNSAPDYGAERFVIYIKEGVYKETVRIPFEKTNVFFLGDGMGKTIITGSHYVGMEGVTTDNSCTVGVSGDGFIAKGLTIENTAGPDVQQAVAFRSDSDHSVLEEVEFLGHQDTLYVQNHRQFYKSCRIAGTVDFIFGNGAAVFQNCFLLVQPRQLHPEGEINTIAAQGRMDPAQSTGFVFQNCVVNGTDDYMVLYRRRPEVHQSYLGRPWKKYSRTVFIRCHLEALIRPEGWIPWAGDFGLKTLFFGEFESTGPGANPAGRVPWSSQISAEHVLAYSVQNFIQGNEWIPPSS